MAQVTLNWTPSISAAVDLQRVSIFDSVTQTVYGTADLDPTAAIFTAEAPEGATVQGVVNTIRGADEVAVLSNVVQVPYAPLVGATDVVLSLPVITIRGR